MMDVGNSKLPTKMIARQGNSGQIHGREFAVTDYIIPYRDISNPMNSIDFQDKRYYESQNQYVRMSHL